MLKQKQKVAVLTILVFSVFFVSVSNSQGAAGTTGALEVGTTSAFDGAIVAVRAYQLEAASTYKVNSTGDATGFSFQTGASQTEYTIYLTIDKPAGSETVYIWLYGDVATTALDTYTLQVKDDSIIPDEFLISLGITLLVLFLIVGIVKRMRK